MIRGKTAMAVEGVRGLYRQAAPILAANLANGSLVTAALWPRADDRLLAAWIAMLVLVNLSRLLLWTSYLWLRPADAALARWGRLFTLGTVASGLVWGSSGVLFVGPADPQVLLLISFVLGGMAAGAMVGLGSHLPTFYFYLATAVLPLEGRLLSFGDRFSLSMAGMLALFVISMAVIGRSYYLGMLRRAALTEQNEALLANREQQVRERTAQLSATNALLQDEIAERRRTERALEEARAEAERANQAKSRFLAAASHDLRQPMQSLFLFSQTLHRHVTDKQGINALIMLERGLDILKDLLDSLLDVSRLDVDVIRPQLARIPLDMLIDEVVAAYRPIAASKGISVQADEVGDLQVHSDPVLLGRMLRNLVENAVRYTERGGVVIASQLAGDRVRVEVRDSGIGIAAEQLDRIFEEFHQVANPERDKAQGLGLGLAIVERLSAILDHPVDVRSELGAGSIFSIEVPVDRNDGAAGFAPVQQTRKDGAGRMVVLIDDDPMVLLGLRGVFVEWGYEVVIAGSAGEAVQLLRGQPRVPALVVADFRLRGGQVGTEAILDIRSLVDRPVPGIVLTGETDAERVRQVTDLGFTVVHKPVTSHQLAYVVAELIG